MPDATNPPARKKKGRIAFAPSDAQRAEVQAMAAARHHHDAIASAIGCSVPTLRKHFAAELANRMAGENLFAATGANDPPLQPAPPSRHPPRTAGGRPKRTPTQAERGLVAELIAVGQPVAEIAVVLKGSEPWVRRAFAAELAHGAILKRAELAQLVWRAAKKGSVPAMRMVADMLETADLAKTHASLAAQDATAARKPVALGKKAEAQAEADRVLSDSSWSDLLRREPPAQPLN